MNRPPVLYRSGIATVKAHRGGPCVDCRRPVHHVRTFTAVDAAAQAEAWKAQTLRCFRCSRANARALAGVQ